MRQLTTRSILVLAALATAVLAFAPIGSARSERPATATATTVQVKGGEFFFRLSKKSIAKPGKVTFVLKNIGHIAHDFRINHKTTRLIQPGKTASIVVTFKKKGKYGYLCTVPGHAASGMRGTFTVR
jgi:uncharacterized cupredoxin-like copper-binding protein